MNNRKELDKLAGRWFQESTIHHHIREDGRHIADRAKFIARKAAQWGAEQAAHTERNTTTKDMLFELVKRAPNNSAIKSLVEALDFFYRNCALPEMKGGDWSVLSGIVSMAMKPTDGHYNQEQPIVTAPAEKVPAPEAFRLLMRDITEQTPCDPAHERAVCVDYDWLYERVQSAFNAQRMWLKFQSALSLDDPAAAPQPVGDGDQKLIEAAYRRGYVVAACKDVSCTSDVCSPTFNELMRNDIEAIKAQPPEGELPTNGPHRAKGDPQ